MCTDSQSGCAVCALPKVTNYESICQQFDDESPVGCYCNDDLRCIEGRWSTRSNAVVGRPLAEWKFNRQSAILLDSSGHGYHSSFKENDNYRLIADNNVTYINFNGTIVIDFSNETMNGLGLRDFAVEATLRFSAAK